MSVEPVSVNLGEFLAERLLKNLQEQPLTVDLLLSDGTVTMEISPKHRWYKALSQRRNEQVQRLRESYKGKSKLEGVRTDEGTTA